MSSWPLLQFVEDLAGFDFVALLLGAVVVFFSIGFAIDYIVGRYGMGPYWSGFYAMLGAYAGLCIREWWLQPYAGYDPYLTTIAIAAGLLTTVVMVTRGRQTLNPASRVLPRVAPKANRKERLIAAAIATASP